MGRISHATTVTKLFAKTQFDFCCAWYYLDPATEVVRVVQVHDNWWEKSWGGICMNAHIWDVCKCEVTDGSSRIEWHYLSSHSCPKVVTNWISDQRSRMLVLCPFVLVPGLHLPFCHSQGHSKYFLMRALLDLVVSLSESLQLSPPWSLFLEVSSSSPEM